MGYVKIHKSTIIVAILILIGVLAAKVHPQSQPSTSTPCFNCIPYYPTPTPINALHPAMPDPKLTPCTVDPTQPFCLQPPSVCNQTILCAVDSHGHKTFHTSDTRKVSESLKHKICREYGITQDCPSAVKIVDGKKVYTPKYEIDHLISLELCGSDDPKNLWPQPYTPPPGSHEKDVLENWLSQQVCANKMTLDVAQHAIAVNWWASYILMIGPIQVIGQ